jgi:hypothetical protein
MRVTKQSSVEPTLMEEASLTDLTPLVSAGG